ncbi:S-adenosyl-L-methionine-dependent methyltransferase [Choiromyces venosus 120613-1]|uniref:S-adenosyl-L-methionine-dependent methyltransferase n=1 Tax=Choiromyces venosus 120613-1 TaxID=1336337 RepID=A0A3N4J6L8_9PEZI|nr:S-adenosyl-L-methionine-dependent methyltransferase [Choiromyces venosus 120613-1]
MFWINRLATPTRVIARALRLKSFTPNHTRQAIILAWPNFPNPKNLNICHNSPIITPLSPISSTPIPAIMGRGQKKGRGGNNGGRNRRNNNQGSGERGNYASIPTENALYESYYKQSGLIPSEEWDEFWSALQRTLPTTFRFTGGKVHALGVLKTLKEKLIPHLVGIEWEGVPVEAPKALEWFPDNLAWQLSVGKSTIRRCPPFKMFQNFLVAETTVGNISRQEAVSMIPPLVMDIQPHHVVLDMCAAPGSKTAQLIEAIHANEEAHVQAAIQDESIDNGPSGRPTGLVIANDADYRRSHMLIHQTKRLNSPNLIVTNHDATMYPSLLIKNEDGRKEYLKFDRILADVPCSGDGTARKNYNVWRDWNPLGALGLHLTQVRILVRGLQMLKVGGRIVYSTCSMNPIENEAVIAAAIDRCGGLEKVNIVDCSDRLPELKRRPGIKGGWRVMDKDGSWFSSFEQIDKSDMREARLSRIVPSMFPSEDGKSDEDESRVPLERCMRVYPHLQDTGGFFITVLEKMAEIGAVKSEEHGRKKMAAITRSKMGSSNEEGKAAEEETPVPGSPSKRKLTEVVLDTTPPVAKKPRSDIPDLDENDNSDGGVQLDAEEADTVTPTPTTTSNPPKKNKGQPVEEPFKYLPTNHPVLENITQFYDLSPRFPKNCFMVRNAEGIPSRAIYFTNQLAKQVLTSNEGSHVKFVHCGVKAFMKQDVQGEGVCPWRIQSEGLSILEGWIGETRVVRAKKRETVRGLLKELFPKVHAEGQEGDVIGEIEERVRNMSMGCCVLKVEAAEGEFEDSMVFPLWKSRHSCNLMLPKDERKAMLMRLFNDESGVKDSTNKNSHLARDAAIAAATTTTTTPVDHKSLMSQALLIARKSTYIPSAFCVGAMITTPSGTILSTGYSREHPGNTHAEQVAIDKLVSSTVPEEAVVYTTMEPCSKRLSGNKSCVDRILECGWIKKVYVGVDEPGDFVENSGRGMLEAGGIRYEVVEGLAGGCLAVARGDEQKAEEKVEVQEAGEAADVVMQEADKAEV